MGWTTWISISGRGKRVSSSSEQGSALEHTSYYSKDSMELVPQQ
jgi:hypothetical protein